MAQKQDTLIYIEKENAAEAEFMSRSFVNPEIKNRAYINAIGAELLIKYLASEGIKVSNLHNIHSISKILEKIDIADVLLPNIHIDARVIFDERYIFIPKSHFKLEITPDIYAVLKLDNEFKYVEFLGYVETQKINKKNANADYYFVEKSKLSSPDTLKQYIKNFTGSTSRKISNEDMLRGRELSISLADHNISQEEEKELLELLLLSDDLRESILEFDNFETLSYSAAPELEKTLPPGGEFTLLTDENIEENNNSDEENLNNAEISLNLTDEDMLLDESFFDNFSEEEDEGEEEEDEGGEEEETDQNTGADAETEEIEADENNAEDEENSDAATEFEQYSSNEDIEDEIEEVNEELPEPDDLSLSISNMDENLIDLGDDMLDQNLDLENNNTIEETTIQNSLEPLEDLGDDMLEDEEGSLDADIETEEKVEDESIEETIDTEEEITNSDDIQISTESAQEEAIEKPIENINENAPENEKNDDTDISKGLAATISNALQNAGKTTAQNSENNEGASQDAIKLAGIAGDMISDVVNKNIEKQQHNLDKIDYAKTDITPDTQEIPEHIAALDLSTAKIEANLEAEISGDFDTPTDLSELKSIENPHHNAQEVFEHETIDLGQMKTVKTEEFKEHTEDVVNLEHLSNVDSPTKPVDNLHEIMQEPEFEGMDLPDLSTYTINEDGTSTMDNFAADISMQNNDEEHLINMNLNNEISFDNDFLTDDFDMLNNESEDLLNDTTTETISTESEQVAQNNDVTEHTLTEDEIAVLNSIKFDEEPSSASEQIIPEDNSFEEDLLTSQDFSNDLTLDDSLELSTDDFNSEMIQEPDEQTSSFEQKDTIAQNDQADYSEPQLIQEEDLQSELSYEDFEAMTNDTIKIQDNNEDIENNQIFQEDQIQQPELTEEQDWMADTDYDNLQDVEIPQPESNIEQQLADENIADEIHPDEFITEPEAETQKVYAVRENSRVISDRTFQAGEIFIDINNPNMPELPQDESLESLYNQDDKLPGSSLLQNPGRLTSNGGIPRAGLGIGLGIVGALITLAIVCVIGINVAKMFKTPTEETPQPITDDALPTSSDNGVTEGNTLNVNPNNVVNMDNNTNALATTKTPTVNNTKPQTAQQSAQKQQAAQPIQTQKKQTGTSFIEVKKLTWEVPDYVSYNPQFKQYFQSVGKSLKLSLTSDLLLASDYAYSNEVRVSVTFDKEGTFKNSQIIISSGSTQIDNIVLQTVNQTLKVLKAPHSVGNDESTTAILKIYL